MLIQNIDQLLANIKTLNSYKDSEYEQFYRKTIEKGRCFVVLKNDGSLTFSPSRFVGYVDNTYEKHLTNDLKHGGLTNAAIEALLGKLREDEIMDNYFLEYCQINGLTPSKVKRKYWMLDTDNSAMELVEDIKNLDLSTKESEKQTLIMARVGQGKYREGLLKLWGGCSVTGFSRPELLRASHIKPWKQCSNQERLDVYNGLLLMPHLDLMFDKGYITFDDLGCIIISKRLTRSELLQLNIDKKMKLKFISSEHMNYLEYHRMNIFFW